MLKEKLKNKKRIIIIVFIFIILVIAGIIIVNNNKKTNETERTNQIYAEIVQSDEITFKRILDNDNEFHTLWHSVKLNEDGTYNKIENYENVGTSSDNTHGNVHLEKGETKTITLYYLITDEEFENETLAIDFHYYGSPCKGTLAIVHEPEEN